MNAPRILPDGFAAFCQEELGAEAPALLSSLGSGEPTRSVRLNPAKPSPLAPEGERVEWCDGGIRLPDGHGSVTLDPLFHAGAYYVQDASSMIVKTIVAGIAGQDPLVVVDACAAPGGKTTAAIDALPAGSIVVANEIMPARCRVLAENLMKWGYPATIVTRGDTASLARAGEVADIIIADVPCSGEGMMRKDEEAVAQWTPRLVDECVARQKEIVDNLWTMLRPGGTMIYSTCTFNRRENELMVEYIARHLGGEPSAIPGLPACIAPGIGTALPCYRFMPHRLQGEGLFVAVITKPGDSSPRKERKEKDQRAKKKSRQAVDPAAVKTVAGWLRSPVDFDITERDGLLCAIPREMIPLLDHLDRVTTVVAAGVAVAEKKGKDLIPHHGLAMSTALSPDSFPRVELPLDDARDYLRRSTLTLPPATPRGYVAVTYSGLPLGFMKHLGNRSNNLYPSDYRIKFL